MNDVILSDLSKIPIIRLLLSNHIFQWRKHVLNISEFLCNVGFKNVISSAGVKLEQSDKERERRGHRRMYSIPAVENSTSWEAPRSATARRRTSPARRRAASGSSPASSRSSACRFEGAKLAVGLKTHHQRAPEDVACWKRKEKENERAFPCIDGCAHFLDAPFIHGCCGASTVIPRQSVGSHKLLGHTPTLGRRERSAQPESVRGGEVEAAATLSAALVGCSVRNPARCAAPAADGCCAQPLEKVR